MKNMTFGQALEALKAGKKVARRGWNGKMFLWLKPATTVKTEWCHDPVLRNLVESNGGEIPALGTICMLTYDPTGRAAILTGWLASQSDMLFEDWEVVGERNDENADEQGNDDEPDREDSENKAEALGKSLGTMLVPFADLVAGQGKLPEIRVNVWSLGK